MDPTETRIAKFLLDTGLLDQFQYQSAKDHQSQAGGKFHMVVMQLGLVPEERMVMVMSKVIGLPKVTLTGKRPDPEALKRLSVDFCNERLVYPSALIEGGTALRLVMADPTDVATRNQAQIRSGLKIRPVVAAVSEVREAVRRDYGIEEKKEAFVMGSIDLSLTDEEANDNEFKVTDLSGKTLVKHEQDLSGRATLARRLEKLIEGQEKFETAMQDVIELCVEKGLFSPAEIQERMKKR
jgi:hypothetical protein